MFTKKPDRDASAFDSPRSAPPIPSSSTMTQSFQPMARSGVKSEKSLIAADLTIVGNLLCHGEVGIDGEIQGDVHAVTIVIGETAIITGSLVADEIVVRGTVMGTIRAKRVALQSSSKVEGDIYHSQLAIEQGAFFEGKSRRMDDPTAGVQRPDGLQPNGGMAGG